MPHVDPANQATLFRGLADPARLGLLLALRQGPCPAGELARRCSLSASNASNHLQCLLECGLVALEVQGRHNVYSLADPLIAGLLEVSERIVAGLPGPSSRRVATTVRRRDGACGRRRLSSRSRPASWVHAPCRVVRDWPRKGQLRQTTGRGWREHAGDSHIWADEVLR